jgi:AcrR family transcriptional regulator
LVLERGYEAVTASNLAKLANIGRSTFYEHFLGVDEVLAFSIARLLAPLVTSSMKAEMDPSMVMIIQHFWDNRKVARAMFAGEGHTVVLRLLTEQFETALVARSEAGPSLASPKLAAAFLAAGALALLGVWLSGQASGSAGQIAHALHTASHAFVLSLDGDTAG